MFLKKVRSTERAAIQMLGHRKWPTAVGLSVQDNIVCIFSIFSFFNQAAVGRIWSHCWPCNPFRSGSFRETCGKHQCKGASGWWTGMAFGEPFETGDKLHSVCSGLCGWRGSSHVIVWPMRPKWGKGLCVTFVANVWCPIFYGAEPSVGDGIRAHYKKYCLLLGFSGALVRC